MKATTLPISSTKNSSYITNASLFTINTLLKPSIINKLSRVTTPLSIPTTSKTMNFKANSSKFSNSFSKYSKLVEYYKPPD